MECMANSDNVIRAGLTPKLRDVPNLVSGLTYVASLPAKHTVDTRPFDLFTGGVSILYDPPIPEFSVVQARLYREKEERHRPVDGPSVAIVTEGAGLVKWRMGSVVETLEVRMGDVFFIGAGTELDLLATAEEWIVYRAFVEVGR